MNVTIGLSFLAGLASFLSPCVFALIPAYISYLSGRSLEAQKSSTIQTRLLTFSHGLAFVAGFSVIFILLGLTASVLGRLMQDISPWLTRIGGIFVILFGLHITGLLRIPLLEYDVRPQTRLDQKRGYLSSFLMGIFFSAGWSPCTGPVLGAIFMLALNSSQIARGILMLTAYSAGLAIPFLIAAIGIDWVLVGLKKYRRVIHYIEISMGVLLIIIGILLFLGLFQQLARFSPLFDFGL